MLCLYNERVSGYCSRNEIMSSMWFVSLLFSTFLSCCEVILRYM